MKKSELTEIVREVIRETIRKVDGKYVVYPEKGGKRLGTHSTKKAAEKQLTAIHLNKMNEQFIPSSLQNLVNDYLFFITMNFTHLEKTGKSSQDVAALTQMIKQAKEDVNKLKDLTKDQLEKNKNSILKRIHDMLTYIISRMKAHMRPEEYEKRRDRLNKLLVLYKNAAKVQENYADGKVKDILSKYIDDYTEIDINVLNKLLKDKKKYPKELDPRTGGNKFGYRGMTFKKDFIEKLKEVKTSNGVTEYEVPSNIKITSRSNKGYLSFTVDEEVAQGFGHYSGYIDYKKSPDRVGGYVRVSLDNPNFILHPDFTGELSKDLEYSKESEKETLFVGNSFTPDKIYVVDEKLYKENYADGKVKGKSRPGRVKKAGASCKGSVTDLRAKAKKYGGEKGKMYHWCANMKAGKK